mgnify:CR=1 FL=1
MMPVLVKPDDGANAGRITLCLHGFAREREQ